MQFTTIATLFAVTIASVAAIPGRSGGSRPDRPAPVLIYNTNSCSGGIVYCCSPNDGNTGTVCKSGQTQCTTVSICCNNNNIGDGSANQYCSNSVTSLIQPVSWW